MTWIYAGITHQGHQLAAAIAGSLDEMTPAELQLEIFYPRSGIYTPIERKLVGRALGFPEHEIP